MDEAERQLRRAVVVKENAFGLDISVDNLGLVLYELGRYREALPVQMRAAGIFERAGPTFREDLSQSLNNLALTLMDGGLLDDAERFFKRSQSLQQQPSNDDLALYWQNLGVLYRKQGRFQEAEGLLSKVLAYRRSAPGTDPFKIAESLCNLASLYWHLNRNSEAQDALTKCLERER